MGRHRVEAEEGEDPILEGAIKAINSKRGLESEQIKNIVMRVGIQDIGPMSVPRLTNVTCVVVWAIGPEIAKIKFSLHPNLLLLPLLQTLR